MLIKKLNLNKEKLTKYGFILASILISVTIIYFRKDLAKLSELGYLGVFLINLVGSATVIIPAPAFIASFIGGSIYNPILVGLFSAVGASIGELTGYLAGYGGSAVIKEDKNYRKVEKWMTRNGFLTILVLAAIPNPFFDISGIISGVTNYSIRKFLLATLIGKSIKFLIIALLGSRFII
jgi:uncharacterized membrane protein YdjX (TVP38/TMEM64 family)